MRAPVQKISVVGLSGGDVDLQSPCCWDNFLTSRTQLSLERKTMGKYMCVCVWGGALLTFHLALEDVGPK